MSDASYIHGTAPNEQQRLAALNRLTNPPFIEFLKLPPAARVLEIGSGLGMLAADVADAVAGGMVVGVEFSTRQLAMTPRGHARLSFAQADGHHLPLADNAFDLVYCRYLLEHVRDPQRVVCEAYRVLKPGGRFQVQENDILVNVFDPECPTFDRLWRQFAVLQQRLGGDARVGRRLLPLLQRAGFTRIELSIQPEVHWSGSPGFVPWVDNLIGNVVGAAEQLIDQRLADQQEISRAVVELEQLKRQPDATAWFYWNRALGVKGS